MNQPYLLPISHLEKYKNKSIPWGFNGLGYIVYKRTYARIQDNDKQEEWGETILRCINGAQEIGAKYTEEEALRLFDYIYNLKCSFAGRMLWMLGTKFIKRWGGNALCNCFFISITEPEDFCFLFENLMMGGGVGYSVRREDVHELPKVKENVKIIHLDTKDADFIIPDSREGWVALLRKVLRSYFTNGKSFSYSTILVRGYGEKIKGLGGTASGSQILVEGIENICKVFNSREGKKLRSIDVLDLCNVIASIVISGNLRRSASIALGDPDDYLFLRAKRWDLGNIPNWRSLSNNTLYIDDFTHIQNDVWEGYKGNGEPYGFFNLPLAKKYGRLGETVNDKHILGINPCFTGDTKIDTLYGKIPIEKLVGKETLVYCYDGNKINISTFKNIRKTGTKKEVWKILLDNKEIIKVTPNHKFMLRDGSYKEVRDLKVGDSLMPFNRHKRNSKGYFNIGLNNGEFIGEAQFVCEWKYNRKMKKGECVHHIDENKQNNSPENLEFKSFSLHSSDNIKGNRNPIKRFPNKNPMLLYPNMFKNEKNPRWNSSIKTDEVVRLKKQGWSISKIAEKYNVSVTPIKKRLELALLNNHKIKAISFYGHEDVYDGEVEKYRNFALACGIIVHNCGEINLPSGGVCCLSELFLNNISSKEELIDCAKLLYKTQKAVCGLTYLHEKTNKVVHRDYRIGISVTGICQSIDKIEWLDETYNELRKYDKEWSKVNNLPESIKLTTCKPSGTISLLSGSSPGVHPAFSKYYIRRVRMSSNDPLIEQCKALGYKTEYVKGYDGENDYKTIIVEFPCFAGDNVIVAKNMSAIKQLELVKQLQTVWADNSVSCTIYFKKDELEDIKKWLKENYNDHVKAISFLLHQDHGFEQAPYEEITKEKYEEMISKVKSLTELIVKEGDTLIEECKGACPIK